MQFGDEKLGTYAASNPALFRLTSGQVRNMFHSSFALHKPAVCDLAQELCAKYGVFKTSIMIVGDG
jgi:hypothetical protein